MVLTLGELPDPRAVRLIERLNTGLPVLLGADRQLPHRSPRPSRIEGRLSADTPRKVEAALGAFEAHVDTAALTARAAT